MQLIESFKGAAGVAQIGGVRLSTCRRARRQSSRTSIDRR
jgi:hypothetical protein